MADEIVSNTSGKGSTEGEGQIRLERIAFLRVFKGPAPDVNEQPGQLLATHVIERRCEMSLSEEYPAITVAEWAKSHGGSAE